MSRRTLGHLFYMIDNKFILLFDKEVYRKFYPVIDFDSFEIIESNGLTFHYFKDKNHVYLESYMNHFAIIPDGVHYKNRNAVELTADNQRTYGWCCHRPLVEVGHKTQPQEKGNLSCTLPDATAKDFEILVFDSGRSTSVGNDYLFAEKLPHRFASYKVLSECYHLVKGVVYFNYLKAMPEADVATVGILYERVGNSGKRSKIVE